jgi:hypothetical protein
MEGRFGQARELYADSVAVYHEFGLRFRRAVRSMFGAQIEWLAGDLHAAEHELRNGYTMLEEMGERGARSTVAAMLADVLAVRGDDVEAERFVEIVRDTAAETDVMPQVLWRRAVARTAARRGDRDAAESFARASVALAETTDCLDLCAGSLVALAEVAEGADEAAARLDQARQLYETKGNIPAVQGIAARQSVP